MIKFECETCFQEYQVRDDRAGQVLKCKSCGHKMRVPAGEEEPLDDMYEEVAAPTRPARKKKTSGSSSSKKKTSSAKSKNPVVIVVGVCAFAITFFVSYLFVSGLSGKKNQVEILQNAIESISESAESGGSQDHTKQQKWISLVDAPRTIPEWPESPQLSIDLEHSINDRVRPHSISPYVGVWYDVDRRTHIHIWNLMTEKKVNEIKINTKKTSVSFKEKTKLSMDGKYLLLAFQDYKAGIPKMESWDVTNGKLQAEWEVGPKDTTIEEYDICSNTRAITKSRQILDKKYITTLKLWDLTSGKLLKEREIESSHLINSSYKISPGGKFLIAFSSSDLFVYDMNSLDLINEIKLDKFLNSDEIYYNISDISFSADGKELALLTAGLESTSIWTIDLNSGKSTQAFHIAGSLSEALREPGYAGPNLDWNPDGTGWLLHGVCYVDRAHKKILWTLNAVPNVTIRDDLFLTPDYLIAATGTAIKDANGRYIDNRIEKLIPMAIPERQISDSLAAYTSQSNAILGSGQEISIEINIGDLKFDNAAEVKTILAEVIKKRLETDGFKVSPDQPIVFKMEYQEQAGHKLQLSQSPVPIPGNPMAKPTGKTIQATAAVFKISWIDQLSQKILWSKESLVNPRFLILRDATAEEARKQMFEALQSRLMAESIPYFIPKDKNLSILPLEIALPE